jgi:Leucine-rich repeat (LRR) protein
MDIYNSTNGSNWSNRSGWSGSGLNINNNLDGIETATIGGETRVTRVDLWENNLNGSLPSSIGDLDEVTYLNTKGNYLTGRIPTSIGNMASLKTLILAGRNYELGPYLKEPPQNLDYAYHPGKYNSSTNRFSGTIPASFGNLSNLLFLEISD